jgi:hypothetical protein
LCDSGALLFACIVVTPPLPPPTSACGKLNGDGLGFLERNVVFKGAAAVASAIATTTGRRRDSLLLLT